MESEAIPVILSKLKNGVALRTNEVDGKTLKMPEVGSRFVMFAAPLAKSASIRVISTSLVKKITKREQKTMTIQTEYSTYRLKIKGKDEE